MLRCRVAIAANYEGVFPAGELQVGLEENPPADANPCCLSVLRFERIKRVRHFKGVRIMVRQSGYYSWVCFRDVQRGAWFGPILESEIKQYEYGFVRDHNIQSWTPFENYDEKPTDPLTCNFDGSSSSRDANTPKSTTYTDCVSSAGSMKDATECLGAEVAWKTVEKLEYIELGPERTYRMFLCRMTDGSCCGMSPNDQFGFTNLLLLFDFAARNGKQVLYNENPPGNTGPTFRVET